MKENSVPRGASSPREGVTRSSSFFVMWAAASSMSSIILETSLYPSSEMGLSAPLHSPEYLSRHPAQGQIGAVRPPDSVRDHIIQNEAEEQRVCEQGAIVGVRASLANQSKQRQNAIALLAGEPCGAQNSARMNVSGAGRFPMLREYYRVEAPPYHSLRARAFATVL